MSDESVLPGMPELRPKRHAETLDRVTDMLKDVHLRMGEVSDLLCDVARSEGWRDVAGRSLRAPYLSLGEFQDIVRTIRRGIPLVVATPPQSES